MVYHALIMSMLITWISGCASTQHQTKIKHQAPLAMADVYAKSMGDAKEDVAKFVEDNLKEQKTYGYVKPYIPVIQQPVVRKVWVPNHKSEQDNDVLIAGHWVYLMIEGPKWFIDTQINQSKKPVLVPAKPSAVEIK